MNDRKIILDKLEDLRINYMEEQKKFDDLMDEIIYEKNNFYIKLKETESDINNIIKKYEYDIDMREVYNIIDNSQNDAETLFKAEMQKIQYDKEDSAENYRKNIMLYEEKLDDLKRKESTT